MRRRMEWIKDCLPTPGMLDNKPLVGYNENAVEMLEKLFMQ